MSEIMQILITVKTYPTPSQRYRETVCTAGVLKDGTLIRLYPIDYRYRDYSQWYKKYQWIECEVEKSTRDPRPESYKLISDINILSPNPLGTENKWAERKKYVLAKGTKNMCWLNRQEQKNISLAIVKPLQVLDFYWGKTDGQWSQKQLQTLSQIRLFDINRPKSILEKPKYKFFKCEEEQCRGHNMIIEDWEVYALYRNLIKNGEKENTALEKTKEKFLDEICSPKRDTYFFV